MHFSLAWVEQPALWGQKGTGASYLIMAQETRNNYLPYHLALVLVCLILGWDGGEGFGGPCAFWGRQCLCTGWVWFCHRLEALWGGEMTMSKLVGDCLKGEVNAEKAKAASCLADQNEAGWVFWPNKTLPSEWFKARSAAERVGRGSGFWRADDFIQHLRELGSLALFCVVLFCL